MPLLKLLLILPNVSLTMTTLTTFLAKMHCEIAESEEFCESSANYSLKTAVKPFATDSVFAVFESISLIIALIIYTA